MSRRQTKASSPPSPPVGPQTGPSTSLRQGVIPDPQTASHLQKSSRLAFPFFAFSLLLPSLLFRLLPSTYVLTFPLVFKYVLFGAAGWYIALSLRLPFQFLEKKVNPHAVGGGTLVTLASGICEEIVRGVLLHRWPGGATYGMAYSVGLGWAAAECLGSVGRLAARMSLYYRQDERAIFAKNQLAIMEGRSSFEVSPWTEVVASCGSTLLHVGLTIFVASGLEVTFPLAIVHSVALFIGVKMFTPMGSIPTAAASLTAGIMTFAGSLYIAAAYQSQLGPLRSGPLVAEPPVLPMDWED
ncbi:hypothetical protein SpCBS45565_g00910 [Spizellomyces sp. 'palustris']|nr:hypothetical protein SpCBS45565_g00910 [Spizellomyces sp. 'palustris']